MDQQVDQPDPDLASRLAALAPFDALEPGELHELAAAAGIERHRAGTVLLDAFLAPAQDVLLVLHGRVALWEEVPAADTVGRPYDLVIGPGEMFGFSALLTGRAVGPRAVAVRDVVLARLPRTAVEPVFASGRGARFLADELSSVLRKPSGRPSYAVVDDLLAGALLRVDAGQPAHEVARLMTEQEASAAVLVDRAGDVALVTDRVLRTRLVATGRSTSTPVGELAEPPRATAVLGDSAAEALLALLEDDADVLVVTDRRGVPQGVLAARDFAASPAAAGVSLHEQLRRSTTVDELTDRARQVPRMLEDLLSRGLSTERVIAVHAALLDTVVRRAISVVFADGPAAADLSPDAFTWLALGSVGRREAVIGSDVDSAVAFVDDTPQDLLPRYREAFGEVAAVLAGAGLSTDGHGASAEQPAFSRTNADWRSAARSWMAGPEQDQGAVMAALLVDGRPIHGDPGLPAAASVMSDLRSHRGTMRLLLEEALAAKARLGPRRGLLGRRLETFEVKSGALQPIVRIARWAALTAGSPALATVDRLRSAAGTAILPDEQAETLIEVFGVLQGLRLRHQLHQHREGVALTDELDLSRVSAIDRAVIAQAVREVAAVQRRMANVSAYAAPEEWTYPER